VILFGLLVSIERRSSWNPRERTRLYRVVEIIGRWSMLDMFVVSLTVALVQLGVVANVEPGIGASFFAAVVVLTIFAASSFDPRLIWDAMEEHQ
jgi:paraquat-inducible protein A